MAKIEYLDRVEAATEEGLTGVAGSASRAAIEAIKKRLTLDFGYGLGLALLQGMSFGWGDEAIAGLAALAGGDYEKVRDKMRADLDKFRSEDAAIAYGAEIAAALLTPGGVAKVVGGGLSPLARAVAGGAIYGAGTAEEAEDVPLQAAVGGLIGAGGEALAPTASAAARALRQAGVRVTPGQLYPAMKRAEEALTSVPFLGGGIRSMQRTAVQDFPAMMYNRALKPIGVTLKGPLTPRAAGIKAQAEFRKRYDQILGGVEIDFTDEVLFEINEALLKAKRNLGEARRAEAIDLEAEVLDEVIGRLKDDRLSGDALKEIQSLLGKRVTQAVKQNEFRVADAYGEVDEALMSIFTKYAPQKSKELAALDKAYANFIPLRRAAAAADEGAFTPAQALQAVRAEERKLGATGAGRLLAGEARMQRPAEIAKQVIGGNLPDSGTASRLFGGLALMGGAGALTGSLADVSPEGAIGGVGLGLLGRGVYGRIPYSGRLPRAMPTSLIEAVMPVARGTLRSPATAGLLAEQLAPTTQSVLFGGEARAESFDQGPESWTEQTTDRLGNPMTVLYSDYGASAQVIRP